MTRNLQEQAKALDALYAELPTIDCQGRCSSSCGPINMTEPEWRRIQLRLGHTPRAVSMTCPMLVRERCSVYAIRPLICRLWGIVERMPCPWGCKPEPRYLTSRESFALLARTEIIGATSPAALADAQALLARLEEATDEQIAMSESLMIPPVEMTKAVASCECGWGCDVQMPTGQWESGEEFPVVCRACQRILGRSDLTEVPW
jgi:Fe-S-cluster containining protein